MIIDCHTHWGMCWKDKYDNDPRVFMQTVDKYCIDKLLLMGHESLCRIDKCVQDNKDVAQTASKNPEKIIPVFTVWPQDLKAAKAEMRRCVENNMRFLKVHPWLQGFSTSCPEFGEICLMAGDLNVPIILHDGTPCYSLSEQVAGLARRFPKTVFIMGHSGMLWNWTSAIEAMRQENVWATLCGVHLKAIEIFSKKTDTARLLWGSDFGFGFSDSISYRFGLIHKAKIPSKIKEKILYKNALNLINHT